MYVFAFYGCRYGYNFVLFSVFPNIHSPPANFKYVIWLGHSVPQGFLQVDKLMYALANLAVRVEPWEELIEEWLQAHVKELSVQLTC